MKSEAANDSLDIFIRQAVGRGPSLSFSRTADNPMQWIQLLHTLDQQDLPGWPLLPPLKVQMQKCDKCSREFCSLINYRRHIRVHRRSFNVDKESHKNKDLLGAFWDKLSLDDAKEILSFKDVTLEDVSGSSIIRALASFIRKPGVCAFPQAYVKAGSALLDIIQAGPSRLPISSWELFNILEDASERTFLCAGTAESLQKFVFDGEAGKIGLESKNVVACTCFLIEQKLVNAWLADKDAEALRCQKLLVEEEEAAQKRQVELLERKRQKKLRQKEQKAKDLSNNTTEALKSNADTLEIPPSTEIPNPPFPSECNFHPFDTSIDVHDDDANKDAPFGFTKQLPDQNIESQTNGHQHLVITRWRDPKLQRTGQNGFKPDRHRGCARVTLVHDDKLWARKPEQMIQADENRGEVIIGSICVPVRIPTSYCLAEARENPRTEDTISEKNNDWCGPNSGTRAEERPLPIDSGDLIFPSEESCEPSCDSSNTENECGNSSPVSESEAFLFSSSVARAFLAQRWKKAISCDHVNLVSSLEPQP